VETARPLATKRGLKIELRDGLKEINYGKWELKSHAEIKTEFKSDYDKWISEPAWNSPTDGETAFQIAERSCAVLQEAMSNHADGAVLLVSHKATIRIMLCSLLGIELGRYRDRVNALTGSVSVVTFDQHGPRLDILGDRNHLRPELRNREGT
jgi:probable phosphoglycerate mutase